jgi:tetratricopeptide (TPR) repeat protein
VVQVGAELERLSAIAPSMLLYRDLCSAYLVLMRGEAKQALAIYERCAAAPHAHLKPAYEHHASLHAEALVRLGRLDEAKSLCEHAIRIRAAQGAPRYGLRAPMQQLALVEAKLGNFERARAIAEEVLAEVLLADAPLSIGLVRRDQARIALIERDAVAFDTHFAAMLAAFRPTNNPHLIQQCRKLLAEAERSGVVASPSWEQHDLAAPANTQELASQTPDVTELVETCA